ncbi:MAG TPA: cyclic nucleotide-binding domain-containing protein [Candidatus Sulfotelmatobacter sp.]|nr:cyclic nucleotide-binding domain-containing protein [Candidatus Sulfotelmatobacter sp.]
MANSVQHDLSILLAAKTGLVYLTANDWTLISDKATRLRFEAGEYLIHRGEKIHGVYLLLKGQASVLIPSQNTSLAIGAGEICGEISLLDQQPATADVVATQAVEAYFVDRPTLQSLFELFPHLGSRFYQSVAAILSRRLREVIGPLKKARP